MSGPSVVVRTGDPRLFELVTLAAEDTGVRDGDRATDASEVWRSDDTF